MTGGGGGVVVTCCYAKEREEEEETIMCEKEAGGEGVPSLTEAGSLPALLVVVWAVTSVWWW